MPPTCMQVEFSVATCKMKLVNINELGSQEGNKLFHREGIPPFLHTPIALCQLQVVF